MSSLNYTEYDKIVTECLELSVKKNKLYGCESLKLFNGLAILSRMNDKIMRINNMTTCYKKDDNEESIIDNMQDLINYSIYFIMLKRNKLENKKCIY